MTTVGYGSIHATNILEYLISLIFFLIGGILFMFFLGNAASINRNLNLDLLTFEKKFDFIESVFFDGDVFIYIKDL